jgi:hypothetical protein
MADLVAADITVSVQPRHKRLVHGLRTVIATVSGGNGAKTYPANGIPLPALGKFGLHSEIAFADIQQPLDGYEYRYDETHHTLRIFQSAAQTGEAAAAAPLVELGNVAVAAFSLKMKVEGQ